jgi:hypothetical protein
MAKYAGLFIPKGPISDEVQFKRKAGCVSQRCQVDSGFFQFRVLANYSGGPTTDSHRFPYFPLSCCGMGNLSKLQNFSYRPP